MSVQIIGPNSLARVGLETALAVGGISYGAQPAEAQVTVVLNGAGSAGYGGPVVFFGAELPGEEQTRFGVLRATRRSSGTIRLQAREPLWSADEMAIIDRYGSRKMTAPVAQRCDIVLRPNADIEVLLTDDEGWPLVLKRADRVWCAFDIATSLALLLTEQYWPPTQHGVTGWLATWRPMQQLYYRLPRHWRSRVQQRLIQQHDARIERRPPSQFVTNYPVDVAGWMLIRALIHAVELAVGEPLPALDAWPEGVRACVVVTHDIEPTAFAYRNGLPRLLRWLASHQHPPHTIDPVGYDARRYPDLWQQPELTSHEIVCHGWLHDGRKTRLSADRILERLVRARTTLEALTARRVTSFRSPRLDRSETLYGALETAGFSCDSTIPDTDRENTDRWGAGCSMNFPFHPAVRFGAEWRRLDLLECPVTAPDCAMPVFAGGSAEEACALYNRKLDYIEAIGGCYVAIFHPGIFDEADAELRERLLSSFASSVQHRPVWRCSLGELERWWRIREGLRVHAVGKTLYVTNSGALLSQPAVARWRDTNGGLMTVRVPALPPGRVWELPKAVLCT